MKIRGRELLRNWTIVYIGNLIGAIATGVLVVLSGVLELNGGAVGRTAASIASTKLDLKMEEGTDRVAVGVRDQGSGVVSTTATAHPNIALIKYWGKQPGPNNLPATPSLSIALSSSPTTSP